MLAVVWRPRAEQAWDDISTYVMDRNPMAALDLEMQITDAAQALGLFPYIGRLGRVPGTRELLAHPNYWIVYQVTVDRVEILDVLHVRREYPDPVGRNITSATTAGATRPFLFVGASS